MVDLGSLPSPGGKAEEGYYPDPLGGKRARWWDGARWTLQLGPLTEPDTGPAGEKGRRSKAQKPISPPTMLCPHCGVEAETFEGSCPHCGKSYDRRNALKVAVAACVTGLVLVGGCGALIALSDEDPANSISAADYAAVKQGESQASVEARLGEPAETEEFEQTVGNRVRRGECLYYNEEGTGTFEEEYFQFCFESGALYLKSEY